MTRILFLGTPDFAVPALRYLSQDPDFQIVQVITQPDRPAGRHLKLSPSSIKKFSQEHELPILSVENINEPETIAKIQSFNCSSAVVVAFGQILSEEFLGLFPQQCLNIHASLLPRWRGAAPIQRALQHGDAETGVSLQVMVKKLDAGPLLGTRKIEVVRQDALELTQQLSELGAELLSSEYKDFLRGALVPVPQDNDYVTIAKKVQSAEGLIDWRHSAQQIDCQIRAFTMHPGCWTTREGKKLKIYRAKPLTWPKAAPGSVVRVSKNSFSIGCGEGALEIELVQPESRPRMAVAEYLKGKPLGEGEHFG